MKPHQFSIRLLAVLIISGTFIHASPAEETSPTGKTLHILSDPMAKSVSQGLVNTFNQTSGWAPLPLETIDPSSFNEQLRKEGAVALLTKRSFAHLKGIDQWSMMVGREAIVPVMNAIHPQSEQIIQQGISPDGFREILYGQKRIYYTGAFGAEGMLADFLGVPAEELRPGNVPAPDQLLEYLNKDPQAIGFCPLTSLIDPEQHTLISGFSLVPIDLNGSGTLEHPEDIYRSTQDLIRGIAIGKYPKTLYTRLYAVTAHQPSSAEEITFLEWLAGEGQESLSSLGWMGLTAGERPSVLNHIRDRQPLLAEQQVAPAASRTVLIICGFLLAMVALVLFVLNRISLRPARYGSISSIHGYPGEQPTSFPAGFFFDRSHTWTFLEKNGQVKVGLDQFLLHVTGPVTRVELKEPGSKVQKGEPLLNIIQQGKKLVIYAPLTGMVTAFNQSLQSQPERINSSPYDLGWIYMIEPERWVSELKNYFLGDRYREWLREEMNRLKDFFSRGVALLVGGVPAPVVQDGGEIRYGILEEFGPEVWEEFQERFINIQS